MLSETRYSDSHRMGLRGTIRVASEALPAFWPMRSFVHHNPLHGLEELPFDRALRQGEHLFGGRGYLPRETYRAYWQAGRIRPGHLDAALQTLANEGGPELALGDRRVGQREVLRACLTHGIGEEALAPARPARGASARPQAALVRAIAERLREPLARRALAPTPPAAGLEDGPALARRLTLADCCDRALGTSIVECVNRELVKWCGAFLDEGHATWPMPGREQGFYLAWRALASRE